MKGLLQLIHIGLNISKKINKKNLNLAQQYVNCRKGCIHVSLVYSLSTAWNHTNVSVLHEVILIPVSILTMGNDNTENQQIPVADEWAHSLVSCKWASRALCT